MTSHYHQIWETLQVANQQLKQWLQTNQEKPKQSHELSQDNQLAKTISRIELEMEIVKELEQSLSEIDSDQSNKLKKGRDQVENTSTLSQLEYPSTTNQVNSREYRMVETEEDDLVFLHKETHRHVYKTIDHILDQDAKYLSEMKQHWQHLIGQSNKSYDDLEQETYHKHNDPREILPVDIGWFDLLKESTIQGFVSFLDMHMIGDSVLLSHDSREGYASQGRESKVYVEKTPFYKRLVFPNGSCKEIYSDGRIETYYAPSQTHKIVFPNGGGSLILFPNGQLERHLSDGRMEVIYADGSIGLVSQDGKKEILFLGNGRVVHRRLKDNRRGVHTFMEKQMNTKS